MATRSLMEFIDRAAEIGELARIDGADWNLEVGCLTEMGAERDGPMLLFDRFADFPPGFRVVSNVLNSPRRFTLALNMPLDASRVELLKICREKFKNLPQIPPVEVKSGPVLENVQAAGEVDLEVFPAPKWHELDGGRYIGTGDIVITRDPDTGWVNLGTYRAQLHEKNLLSLMIVDTHHGKIIARKYWEKGRSCPVAIVLGCDPVTSLAASSLNARYGVSEYDYAGGLHGEPVEVIRGAVTGLPIPAQAEIVVEGEIPPPEKRSVSEGPFGEWPGYYAVTGLQCVVECKRVSFRDRPIIFGAPPLLPTTGTYATIPGFTLQLWDHLEQAGITDVHGVWGFGNCLMTVISLRQRYAGHAKQALMAASGLRGSPSVYRYYVTVDEDVDPSNLNEVLWALWTRVDPETDVEILRGTWTSRLDPCLSPSKAQAGDLTVGRLLINACRPFTWRDKFPPGNYFSREMREQVASKWQHVLSSFGQRPDQKSR